MTSQLEPALKARFEQVLQFAQAQVTGILERHSAYFPIYTKKGKWFHKGELWTDWTGGFLVGMMWIFFKRSEDACWQECAEFYCELLKNRRQDRQVHDLGFIFLNSWLPKFELSKNPDDEAVVLEAGRTLALRFRKEGGYLASFLGPDSLFIDIMMNVPLILYTAKRTGDDELLRIGLTHCQTTQKTLVRADGSTAHEGLFDLQTGRFLKQSTQQGLSDSSVWARGLAWSLYGFAQCYELTGDPSFLETAEINAAYWLSHVPADGIPYWDFHADVSLPPPMGAQKESSAAAIAASGLLTLAELSGDHLKRAAYRDQAFRTLATLATSEYTADDSPGWEGILKHGVYHTRKKLGVDESVMWGEFFFVEGLNKALNS